MDPAGGLVAWKVIRDFGLHSIVGTSLFGVIATPAVGCDYVIKWLIAQHVSVWIVYCLHGAEGLLFASDFVLFSIFIIRTSIRHAKLL
jgi:hypothetical protein